MHTLVGMENTLPEIKRYSMVTVMLAPKDSAGGLLNGEREPHVVQFVQWVARDTASHGDRSNPFAQVICDNGSTIYVPAEHVHPPVKV